MGGGHGPGRERDEVPALGRLAGEHMLADSSSPPSLPQPCSGRAIRATFNGEAVAAKEVDVGKGVEAHEAFITEAQRMHVS